MGLPTDEPRGYLVIKAIEAVGLGQNGLRVWKEDVRDAFLRVELRGENRCRIRVQTSTKPVIDDFVSWEEQLVLEVPPDAHELRIMLCHRPSPEEPSQVIAACGVYVSELFEAVPLEKSFDLFKSGSKDDMGYVSLSFNYLRPGYVNAALPGAQEDAVEAAAGDAAPREGDKEAKRHAGLAIRVIGAALAAGAAIAFARNRAAQRKKKA